MKYHKVTHEKICPKLLRLKVIQIKNVNTLRNIKPNGLKMNYQPLNILLEVT